MGPCRSASDIPDTLGCNTKSASNARGAFFAGANFDDLLGCQFGVSVEFASSSASLPYPSFSDHVGYVIGVGSEEQMFGIHASTVVAVMKNPKPFGNFAEAQTPGGAMGAHETLGFTPHEFAVTIGTHGGLPDPATIAYRDFREKANRCWTMRRCHSSYLQEE